MSGKLISEDYRKLQQQLHENPEYGVASVHFAPLVADVMAKVGFRTVLDYGAGKGRLADELKKRLPFAVQVSPYDPARPEWAADPQPNDFVVCIDVLEHIEPDLLDNVLDDLKRLVRRAGLFTVHTGPAVKVLADGRNAHLIQRPARWWLGKMLERFDLVNFQRIPNGFWLLVEPLQPEPGP